MSPDENHFPPNGRLNELCKLLSNAQAEVQTCQQATIKTQESNSRVQKLRPVLKFLEDSVTKQTKACKKLENSSSLGDLFVYSLCNFTGQTKVERMEQLQKEITVNKDKLRVLKEKIDALKENMYVWEHDALKLPSAKRNYDQLFAEKKALMLCSSDSYSNANATLRVSCQKRSQLEKDIGLLEAAVAAGNSALSSLRIVNSHLSSAGNWGAVDMMGGGLMVTMAKRNAINRAKHVSENAKKHMEQFSRTLTHLGREMQHDLNGMSGFSAFADYFLDGILVDWHVQSQINKAKGSVREALQKVSTVLRETQERLAEKQKQVAQCDQEQVALVLSVGQSGAIAASKPKKGTKGVPRQFLPPAIDGEVDC